jgi:hypothetical protein
MVSLATYLPDSQLITLKPQFEVWTNQKNHGQHLTARDFATFFHEWIHYLHNVSTIHGLSAFANLVHLWTEFRATIGEDGLSRGSSSLSPEAQLRVRQKVALLGGIRFAKGSPLPTWATQEQVSITASHTRWDPIPEHVAMTWTIVCSGRVTNAAGESTGCTLTIGAHEVVESVAYMLESLIARRMGATIEDAPVAPYCLLRLLGEYVSPLLDEQELLVCGLISLQGTNPAEGLVATLRIAEAKKRAGGDVLHFLETQQRAVLVAGAGEVESWLSEIDAAFPVDEPMGRAVRETVQAIRRNMEKRRHSPFFELSVVDRIFRNNSAMNEILKEYGACTILQERLGSVDTPLRDFIYEFAVGTGADPEVGRGRRIMHFAFRFVRMHLTGAGDFRATSEVTEASANRCPAYTACELKPRTESPDTCMTKPWLNATRENLNSCWFADAVCRVAPREIALPLYWG